MAMHRGFVLSRKAYDQGQHTRIELWVATAEGPCQLYIDGEQPVFFITQTDATMAKKLASQSRLPLSFKPLQLKTFAQAPVLGCYAPTIRSSKHFIRLLAAHEITTYEADITLAERYLMERFITGSLEFTGLAQPSKAPTKSHHQVRQPSCRSATYQPELKILVLTAQCSKDGVLLSIGFKTPDAQLYWAQGDHHDAAPECPYSNEHDLMQAVIDWIQTIDPDVIVGWFIQEQLSLLAKAAKRLGLSFKIGRDQQTVYRNTQQAQNVPEKIDIPGRVVLDVVEQLKTASYSFQHWTLDHISVELLPTHKASATPVDGPLDKCQRIFALLEHTHLLEFCVRRVQLTGLPFGRSGGSVAAFVYLYLPRLHRAGYVAPNLVKENWQPSPGGYVMPSVPGLHDSVLVLDFKSLYPAIIRTFLVDPLGLIEGLQQSQSQTDEPKSPSLSTKESAIPGFQGGMFHRTRHILPQMIEHLWAARDQAKANQEKAFSTAIKLIMNSFYGVMGSSGCRFFDTRLAASITCRGHEIMKTTRRLIESQGYSVIYGDTDSLFVTLKSRVSETEAQQAGRKLCETINQWWAKHLSEQYGLTSYLELEHETHYQRFFLPTLRGETQGSKKRYAGLVNKGDSSYVVFKGLESVRSDWTPLAQEFQRQLYQQVFSDQDPSDYVRRTIQDTLAGDNDHQLYYRKRIRRALQSYTKSTPPQVKAARAVDSIRATQNSPPLYSQGGEIEYMMTVAGPQARGHVQSPPDYTHYLSRQLQVVADAILPIIGHQFSDFC